MSQLHALTPNKPGTCEAMMSKDAAWVKPVMTGVLTKLMSQP